MQKHQVCAATNKTPLPTATNYLLGPTTPPCDEALVGFNPKPR